MVEISLRRWLSICMALVFAGQPLVASSSPDLRRMIVERVPNVFIETYGGEVLEIILHKSKDFLEDDPLFLLRFRTAQFFEFDSDRVNPASVQSAIQFAETVNSMEDAYQLIVVGHADSIGTTEYNYDLSQRRALAIVQVLVQSGIQPERIRALGLGEAYPVAENRTPEGRSMNRRVEIFFSLSKEKVLSAPRSTTYTPEFQNTHTPCERTSGECETILPVPRPLITNNGENVGVIDMTDPIERSEKVLRRAMKVQTERRRVLKMRNRGGE